MSSSLLLPKMQGFWIHTVQAILCHFHSFVSWKLYLHIMRSAFHIFTDLSFPKGCFIIFDITYCPYYILSGLLVFLHLYQCSPSSSSLHTCTHLHVSWCFMAFVLVLEFPWYQYHFDCHCTDFLCLQHIHILYRCLASIFGLGLAFGFCVPFNATCPTLLFEYLLLLLPFLV